MYRIDFEIVTKRSYEDYGPESEIGYLVARSVESLKTKIQTLIKTYSNNFVDWFNNQYSDEYILNNEFSIKEMLRKNYAGAFVSDYKKLNFLTPIYEVVGESEDKLNQEVIQSYNIFAYKSIEKRLKKLRKK